MKYLVPIAFIFFLSCQAEQENMIVQNVNWDTDESSNMNAQFATEESEEIDLFLGTHPDWNMISTGTGLRYMVYHKSESTDTAKVGNTVTVDFDIALLSGDVCYSSSENGPESFIVEKSDIESGLHEGVQYMCIGDKAKFIIPSHAAHGLVGDTEKIPPLSPVIYDIELLKIEL
ncbi:MAG: FKBP-type peptidyl-prolyl cis-trans isomerase [Crocinitomix sp.]|jgi:FKBP-type peptidyl-prolyl cis-trans isomerase